LNGEVKKPLEQVKVEVEKLKQLDDYILKDSVEALDMLGKVADTMRKYERVGLLRAHTHHALQPVR